MSKLLPNIILGIVGAAFLIAIVGSSSSPSLEVRRWGAITADDGFAFDITNVDQKTITIDTAKINGRPDCKAAPISFVGEGTLPMQLKVGDK